MGLHAVRTQSTSSLLAHFVFRGFCALVHLFGGKRSLEQLLLYTLAYTLERWKSPERDAGAYSCERGSRHMHWKAQEVA